jgi:outer membrane beta-barrel protein
MRGQVTVALAWIGAVVLGGASPLMAADVDASGAGGTASAPTSEVPNDEPATATPAGAAKEGVDEQGTATVGRTLQERIRAVSRRVFLKANRFELAPQAGLTTNDPFFRSWAFGSRASWHFSEEFAVDVGGAFAPIQQQLDVFRVLNLEASEVDLKAVASTSLVGYVDAGVAFSPLYGKVSLASELVGHFDAYVSSGAALIVDGGFAAPSVHPALQVGVGSRLFLQRWLCLRTDVRSYLYPSSINDELSFGNLILLNLGIGVFFPLDFDYSAETLGSKG